MASSLLVPASFRVSHRRFHRRFVWLALVAWLAQLCLPVAHAAAMAERGGLHRGWCNTGLPAVGTEVLAQKIAALPGEIRRIILQDQAPVGDEGATCALLCAGSAPDAPLAAHAGVVLAEPAHVPLLPQPVATGHGSAAIPPPPRGPPVAAL
ncbi:MAG TPA: hypothetical protein VJM11_01115 [Nevskiaceae bacterium]|nr:hypothetical protein [Nevskiaceae bacterium]